MKGRLIGNQDGFSRHHKMWVWEDEQLVPMWFEMLEWENTVQRQKNLSSWRLIKLLARVRKVCIPSEKKDLKFLSFLMTWFSEVGDCIFKIALKIKIKLSSLNKCKQHASLLLNQFVMNPLLIIYYVFYNLWFYSPHTMIHSSNEWLSAPCSRSMWLDC